MKQASVVFMAVIVAITVFFIFFAMEGNVTLSLAVAGVMAIGLAITLMLYRE